MKLNLLYSLLVGLVVLTGCTNEKDCHIENCHGLEIECGPNKAEVCTMIYQFGDVCRQYAECGYKNGVCKQIINENFKLCSDCVGSCLERYSEDVNQMFMCESTCGQVN